MNALALASIETFRNQIVVADALTLLRSLPPASVHCCVTSPPYFNLRSYLPGDHADKATEIGLEDTPEQFAQRLVEVFRGIWRVLRPDGTLWLNLGDTYAGSGRGGPGDTSQIQACINGVQSMTVNDYNDFGLKRKDLVGIPWRVALALQSDGWYLRTDIIWHKTNAMPSSVTDRPTRDHEYIFLLTKSPDYYYNAAAIREPSAPSSMARAKYSGGKPSPKQVSGVENGIYAGLSSTDKAYGAGRNKRTVWSVATRPLRDGHFAAYPPDLIEPCILAGCPPHVCSQCGAPHTPIVEREPMEIRRTARGEKMGEYGRTQASGTMLKPATSRLIGYEPSCDCGASSSPGIVIDPFIGSGTTAIVAQQHGRDYIGCDLNSEYVELGRNRIIYAGDDKLRRADQQSGAQRLALFS